MQMTEAYELFKKGKITLQQYNEVTQPLITNKHKFDKEVRSYKFKNIKYD